MFHPFATRNPFKQLSEPHYRQQREEVFAVNLYNVYIVETAEELCAAARTFDHAAEVFVTFWIGRTGGAPGEFHVGRGAPAEYAKEPIVRSVTERGLAGIIWRREDGSMRFEPLSG